MRLLRRVSFLSLLTALAFTTLAQSPAPGVIKSEFIYETAPFPECHASTIAESKGWLVAAWFGGTKEKATRHRCPHCSGNGEAGRPAPGDRATIALLKERRAALIAAAVTGEIDVRESACRSENAVDSQNKVEVAQ